MRTITILMCIWAFIAAAGNPKVRTSNKTSQPFTTKVEAVDLNATVIKELGVYPVALYARVTMPAKGEFETTDEYDTRLLNVPEGPFAVRIDCTPTYSADDGAFMVRPKTSSVDADLPRGGHIVDHDVYAIARTALPSTTYIGQNAFGVKKRITKTTSAGYYLRSLKDSPPNLMVILPTEREKAIKMQRSLHLYAICRVPHGYELPPIDGVVGHPNSVFHRDPTITEPDDVTEYQFVIDAEITQLWLVNELTGEVLAKAPYANAAD